jgi:hypothetical protein
VSEVKVTQADKQCADLMYIAKDDMYRRREIAARHRIAATTEALAAMEQAREASHGLGAWMSAALDDLQVCDAMKADINAWFASLATLTEQIERMRNEQG